MNPNIRSALRTAIPLLEAAGVDTPRLDAELLLAHALGANRTALFAHPERLLTADEAARFVAALQRRVRREPLPYITGTREFLGLNFHVTPAVLIPRAETEVLVETVVERLSTAAGREHPFRLLDVGTGSGCIAIGLAHLLPRATVTAVEPSTAALDVARQNAAALGVAGRIEWLNAPFPEAFSHRSREFDAVVSNPPYIAEPDLATLQPEVRDWEPREALTGGPDGLELIRALAAHAPSLLRPAGPASAPGFLALEIALGQAERVMTLLRATGQYASVETVPDLAGILRVCLARVHPPP